MYTLNTGKKSRQKQIWNLQVACGWRWWLCTLRFFNYLENRATYGNSVLDIKFWFVLVCNHFLKTCFAPINVNRIPLEISIEIWCFFLTVHQSIELFHLPTLMHNSLFINNMYNYTTILDMFRALTCPSSGGPIVFSQHLVTSLWKSDVTRCWRWAC